MINILLKRDHEMLCYLKLIMNSSLSTCYTARSEATCCVSGIRANNNHVSLFRHATLNVVIMYGEKGSD